MSFPGDAGKSSKVSYDLASEVPEPHFYLNQLAKSLNPIQTQGKEN